MGIENDAPVGTRRDIFQGRLIHSLLAGPLRVADANGVDNHAVARGDFGGIDRTHATAGVGAIAQQDQ